MRGSCPAILKRVYLMAGPPALLQQTPGSPSRGSAALQRPGPGRWWGRREPKSLNFAKWPLVMAGAKPPVEGVRVCGVSVRRTELGELRGIRGCSGHPLQMCGQSRLAPAAGLGSRKGWSIRSHPATRSLSRDVRLAWSWWGQLVNHRGDRGCV